MLELFEKGGWVMIPLFLCSLLALAVIVERLIWGPSRNKVLPESLKGEIENLAQKRKFEELLGICRADKSPLSRIILTALRNIGRPRWETLEAVRVAGRNEAIEMQRYIGILGTIAAITPLLGLLGTVFGMITTFAVIETEGVGNAPALAGGISEALLTTAAGLTIAIPALVFYRHFLAKTKRLIVEMESFALHALDLLLEPSQQNADTEDYHLRKTPHSL